MPHLTQYDIDGDGVVTDADVQIVKNAIGAKRGTKKYNERWDFNHDGEITAADVLAIAQHEGKTVHGKNAED